MSSDGDGDRRYWLEPNVDWSEEPDLIAIEVQEKDAGYELLLKKLSRGAQIRTGDPLLPKQVRYQTALCPGILFFLDWRAIIRTT